MRAERKDDMDKQYKRLSIEFPADEYVYLKMACAKKHVSLKDFVTQAILKTVEECEDALDLIAFREAYTKENIKNAVPLDQLKKELGYKKET